MTPRYFYAAHLYTWHTIAALALLSRRQRQTNYFIFPSLFQLPHFTQSRVIIAGVSLLSGILAGVKADGNARERRSQAWKFCTPAFRGV